MWFKNLWPHICILLSYIHIWSGICKLHLCILYATKWQYWGMFIHEKTNIAFPPALCELDCNRRSDLRGSGTSASPRTWLVSIGAMCQALVARNIRWEEKYEKNNGVTTVYDTFPLRALQVAFGSLSCSPPWNKDIRVLQLSLSVTVSLIRLKRANTLR